ncbi:YcaO-like family protein [Sulfurimonas sp. SAG-AH-194-I05]|nr:YcaO-like family protein [Sulfurimonas sp. SAG-AH-194-I05]MDF1874814.1 YcaO-like family protein [Sulfurimonas sp. SAG-AH-194-I05]
MDILSKNATAEESIQKMLNALKSMSSDIIFGKQLHSLPNCYSVNLQSADAPKYIYTNGKGTNELSCRASALGEYIERMQTNNFFIEFYMQNKDFYPDQKKFADINAFLNPTLNAFYNPNNELELEDFLDFNTNEQEQVICLPFINQSTNEKVYFPTNIIHNLYVSNGLATGNTPHESKVQALSEIFERYVKIKIIREGYSLPTVPKGIVKSFTKVDEDIKSLEAKGFKLQVLDASLGGEFPVIAISLVDPNTHSLFVSFGCHPILEVCLERTMTELMQGRGVEDLNAFEKPSFNDVIINDNFNIESHFINSDGKMNFKFLNRKSLFEYTPWEYEGLNSTHEYKFLLEISKKMNKDIYVREYNYLGFYSCQIIVPSISEIYPVDDLVYNNANRGKEIRENILNFKTLPIEDSIEKVEHLSDDVDVEKYIGVLFQNNFTLGDFKAQLYLMVGDLESAVVYFESSSKRTSYILAQLCYIQIEELNFEDYYDSLCDVFTKEKLEEAMHIFNVDNYFIDIEFHDEYINIQNLYDRLALKKQSIKV